MLIATTNELLIHSESPAGEIVIAWKNPDETIGRVRTRNHTEDPVEVCSFETVKDLVQHTDFHAWVLQGIRSEEVEQEINRQNK